MVPFDIRGKKALLLQGPMGPFFRRLGEGFAASGADLVHKVNFNGGDRFYYPGGFDFTGTVDSFADYLNCLLDDHKYDVVVLFGDCREHHVVARKVCADRNVMVLAFEEGYLRPHFITLETSGVNGNSTMSRDPEEYRRFGSDRMHHPAEKVHFHTKPWIWWQSFCYALFMRAWGSRYPHYRHHRSLNFTEGLRWISWECGKTLRRSADRQIVDKFLRWVGDRYFVPLQLASDYQVSHHSPYDSVRAFVSEVVRSFSEHAAPDAVLLFKHHPLDPYENYETFIAEEVERHGLQGRVLYCVLGHLPTILNTCTGVITINSTVGISAMLHRRPLCVLGRAIYDLEGLVARDLDAFMEKPWQFVPDRQLFEGFRNCHLQTTQVAGNFHRSLFKGTRTGLIWPEHNCLERQYEKVKKNSEVRKIPQTGSAVWSQNV